MPNLLERTACPVLIVGGLITMSPLALAIDPRLITLFFGVPYNESYEMMIQHWGLMVFIVGTCMLVSAFVEKWRRPVLLYASLEKAALVGLFVVHLEDPHAHGFLLPVIADSMLALYGFLYLAATGRPRTRPPAAVLGLIALVLCTTVASADPLPAASTAPLPATSPASPSVVSPASLPAASPAANVPHPTATIHTKGGRITGMAFDHHAKEIFFGTASDAMYVWELQPLSRKATLKHAAGFVAYSPISRHHRSGPSLILVSSNGEVSSLYPDNLEDQNWVHGMGHIAALSSNGRYLAATYGQSQVAIVRLFSTDAGFDTRPMPHPAGMRGHVASLAFSPTGDILVYGGTLHDAAHPTQGTGAVLVWSRPSATLRVTEKIGHEVSAMAFSRDGKQLAAVGLEIAHDKLHHGFFVVYDMPAAKRRFAPVLLDHPCAAVAFSPNGHVVATASGAHVMLWDAASGKLITRLPPHAGGVSALAFSEDGHLLACGGVDGSVLLWDVKSHLEK